MPAAFPLFPFRRHQGLQGGGAQPGAALTDPAASHIAVIDSDYQVEPFWLRRAMPYFTSPAIALVQGPQDYRDHGDNPLQGDGL